MSSVRGVREHETPLRLAALAFGAFLAWTFVLPGALPAQTAETIRLDPHAPSTPFPHFWEQTFGSGRAILSLRQSYRDDLQTVKQATGFTSVRFHGIFMDEVGLYGSAPRPGAAPEGSSSADGAAQDSAYNFSYVDQIYDGLLLNGVRPYVELSFMPRQLAADPAAVHAFWYHPTVSPPGSYHAWDAMIRAFAEHLVARYGLEEVATWKFEVWNEPNIDFWAGVPKQPTYFELYDHTARALKAVSPRLHVGGPATAQAAWVPAFLAHAGADHVPVDFVSTHVYANDSAEDVFGTHEQIPRETMVYRAVKKVHDEITASPFPNLPLILSEYNASYANEPDVTDDPYMGPWLANTIRLCDGLTESMDYWAFSDVFEEQGVVRTPFYGGFGLIAADGIPKATLNIFRVLHRLGDRRLALASPSALATTTAGGQIALALWNYAPPTGTGAQYTRPAGPAGPMKRFDIQIAGAKGDATVQVWRVDDDHGNVLKAFNAMGRPAGDLTQEQIRQLQIAGTMAPAEHRHLRDGRMHILVPAHGLAVLLVGK